MLKQVQIKAGVNDLRGVTILNESESVEFLHLKIVQCVWECEGLNVRTDHSLSAMRQVEMIEDHRNMQMSKRVHELEVYIRHSKPDRSVWY